MNPQAHQKMPGSRNQTILIKLGGSVLHNNESTDALCQDIKTLINQGFKIVIVHGGSKAINEALNIYNIKSSFIKGLRVTPLEAMKVIEMVLCGQVNQGLVRSLNQIGVPAVGLSGANNHTLLCDYMSEEHGFVGLIKKVNTDLIQCLLNAKEHFIPVVASLGVSKTGHTLNINADLAASSLAIALKVQRLIYITDQQGINNAQGHLFTKLSEEHLKTLIEESIVKEGMLIKVNAILQSMKQGMDYISIANGHQKNVLIDALLKNKNVGTLCVK